MKTAVLTGATGFLGLALLNELTKNGVYVYVLCRPNSRRRSHLNGLSGITVLEYDFDNLDKIDSIQSCDVFYHLAWEGERNNFDEQYKNVNNTIKCLKFASNIGCKRFICTGSQAEYGCTETLITEDTSLKPVTAYGACKVAAFYLTSDLASRLNIEHVWVRVFSVYGPNDNPNTLIMMLMRELKFNGEASLNTDGEHIWNYLHKEDAVKALLMLGQCVSTGTVYNLAGAENKPLKYFIEELRQIIKSDTIIYYGIQRCPVNLNVSISKLYNDIGWLPKVSFKEGLLIWGVSPEKKRNNI